MTHEATKELLLELACGTLPPGRAREVERHAEGCAECRAELAALREARALMSALPQVPAPERGEAVLLAAGREEAERRRRRRTLLPPWFWLGALGGLAALLAVVLSVNLRAGPSLHPDPEALMARAPPAPAAGPPPEPDAPAAPALAAAPPRAKAAAPPARSEPRPLADAPRGGRRAEAPAPAEPLPALAADAAPARKAAAPAEAASAGRAAASAEGEAYEPYAPPAAAPRPGWRHGNLAKADEAECPGETERSIERDETGAVIRRVRLGAYRGERLHVEERFDRAGRLLGGTVVVGDRFIQVTPADVAAGRLEPLPGLPLARTAVEAEVSPPRCAP